MLDPDFFDRTWAPTEMYHAALGIFEKLYKDEDEKKKARLFEGFYHKFRCEFYPLACFAYRYFTDDYVIKHIIGNQGFDATANNSKDDLKIEITFPFDGKTQKEIARILNKKGSYCHPVMDENDLEATIKKWFDLIKKTMVKKARKDYSDSIILLAACAPFEAFEIGQVKVNEFVKNLGTIKFRAKNVYMHISFDVYKEFKNIDYLYKIS
jgi:hypothetical protein